MADFWKTFKPRPEGEQPPLHVAVQAQDLAALQSILDAEAGKAPYEEHRKGNTFLSEKDDMGLCALHHAVKFSNLDIIKALCDIGHPINTKINNKKSGLEKGTSAIILATHGLYENGESDGKRLEVVNLLLAAGATPDKDALKKLLSNTGASSSSECAEVMKSLVQAGATVDKDLVTAAQQKYKETTTTDAGEPAEGNPHLYEIALFFQECLAEINGASKGKGKKEKPKAEEAPQAEEDGEEDEEPAEENHKGKGGKGKGKDKGKEKSQMQLDKAELRNVLKEERPDIEKVKELVAKEVWVTGEMVRQTWYRYQFTCNELESGERDASTGDTNLKELYEFLNENQTPGKGKDDSKGKGKYRSYEDRGGYKGDRDGKGKYNREDRGEYKGDRKGDRGGYKGDRKGEERGGYKGDRKGEERGGYKGDYDGKGKERKGYKGDGKGKDKQ